MKSLKVRRIVFCLIVAAIPVLANSVELIEELLKHGADINLKGPDGKTPLEIAEEQQLWLAVRALRSIYPE